MNWYYWIVFLGAVMGCILYGITDNICHVYIWTAAGVISMFTSWMTEIKDILKELLNELRKFNNIDVKIKHINE